jgi:hypothetical protein
VDFFGNIMIRVAIKPISKAAVEEANKAVPVADTPAGKKAWMDAYIKAGGSHKTIVNKAPPANSEQKAIKLSQKNQAANKQSPGSPGKIVAECRTTLCAADILVITEKGRNYKLELTRNKPQAVPDNPDNIFQVISGWDQESAVDINFLTKSCYRGTPLPCSAVRVQGGNVDETVSPGTGSVKVFCQDPSENWPGFLSDKIPLPFFISHGLFPDQVDPEIYTVNTVGCNGHDPLSARIEAFTHVSWGGKLALKFDSEAENGPEIKKDEIFKTTAGLTKNLTMQYGSKKYSIGFDAKGETIGKMSDRGLGGLIKKGHALVKGIDFLKKLDQLAKGRKIPGVSAVPKVKCTLTLPSVEISGKVQNVEIKDKYTVASEVDFTVSVMFLAINVEGDILDFLAFFYCPPLFRIKEAAQNGVKSESGSLKAVIALKVSGVVKISGDLQCKASGQSNSVTGSINALGGLGLKGEVYVEGRIWRVYAGAGAFAAAMSQESASEECGFTGKLKPIKYEGGKGFDWGGNLKFNGLALYYAVYAYCGTRSQKTDDLAKRKDKGGGYGVKNESNLSLELKEKHIELKKGADLLQPWSYPEENKG